MDRNSVELSTQWAAVPGAALVPGWAPRFGIKINGYDINHDEKKSIQLAVDISQVLTTHSTVAFGNNLDSINK